MIEASARLKRQIPKASQAARAACGSGQHHPAFACSDELVRIEAEDADVPYAAARAPLGLAANPRQVLRGMRFGRILDQYQTMPPANILQRIQVNRMTVDVHGHNGAGPRRDLRFHLCNVHAPGLRITVDQDRNQAGVRHGLSARDNGECR